VCLDNKNRIGVIVDDNVVDLSDLSRDTKTFLNDYEHTIPQTLKVIENSKGIPLSGVKINAPIFDPEKVVCVGLNYRDHAKESNMAIPSEPVIFSKFSSSVVGPNTPIIKPNISEQVDYEVELVVVIGKKCFEVSEENALNYVGGYTIGNDVSARDFQIGRPGGQWLLGKTFATFAPIGPFLLINPLLVPNSPHFNPNNLGIKCVLNDQVVQNSNTNEFIYNVQQVISHVSKIVALNPGDIIFTGTPSGVGFARKPPLFLKPGDVVRCEIEHLGVLENPVVAQSK